MGFFHRGGLRVVSMGCCIGSAWIASRGHRELLDGLTFEQSIEGALPVRGSLYKFTAVTELLGASCGNSGLDRVAFVPPWMASSRLCAVWAEVDWQTRVGHRIRCNRDLRTIFSLVTGRSVECGLA